MEGSPTTAPAAAPTTSSQPTAPVQEQQQGGQGKPEPKAPQSQQAQELFDVKVDGKVVKMTRQEVLDYASMARHANSKFEEAAKLRKEYESKKELYAKNPLQAFLDHASTLPPEQRRRMLEEYYAKEYIEPETLNEDQKRAKELELKLKKYEEEEAQKKQQSEKEQEEALTQKQREFLQGQIIDAMEQSGLPKTKFFVSRMAFYMRQNMMQGWEAPLSLIVKQVQNERQSIMSDLSEGSSPEQLISLLGEGVVNKIRAHDLKQLREKRNQISNPPVGQPNAGTGPLGGREDKVSYAEVNKKLRDMRRGIFK